MQKIAWTEKHQTMVEARLILPYDMRIIIIYIVICTSVMLPFNYATVIESFYPMMARIVIICFYLRLFHILLHFHIAKYLTTHTPTNYFNGARFSFYTKVKGKKSLMAVIKTAVKRITTLGV